MWFWESLERQIEASVNLNEARNILLAAGFREQGAGSRHLMFKRPGSPWNPDTAEAPVKIGVALAGSGLYLLLKYETIWPVCNSIELESLADTLCARLSHAASHIQN
jgi:hypothetical protein